MLLFGAVSLRGININSLPVAQPGSLFFLGGGQVASGEGILGGSTPNFYTALDFSNGLEYN